MCDQEPLVTIHSPKSLTLAQAPLLNIKTSQREKEVNVPNGHWQDALYTSEHTKSLGFRDSPGTCH